MRARTLTISFLAIVTALPALACPPVGTGRSSELRGASGELIGRLTRRSDGAVEARDASGRLRGVYDPNANRTRAADGRLIGTGDFLSALLVSP